MDTMRERVAKELSQWTGWRGDSSSAACLDEAGRIIALIAEDREKLVERLKALADKWDDYDRKRYTGCHSGYAYQLREALAKGWK